jgi:hypothetical protein
MIHQIEILKVNVQMNNYVAEIVITSALKIFFEDLFNVSCIDTSLAVICLILQF